MGTLNNTNSTPQNCQQLTNTFHALETFAKLPNYVPMSVAKKSNTTVAWTRSRKSNPNSVPNTKFVTKAMRPKEGTTLQIHRTCSDRCRKQREADGHESKNQPVCVSLPVVPGTTMKTHSNQICKNIKRKGHARKFEDVYGQTHKHAQRQTQQKMKYQQTRMAQPTDREKMPSHRGQATVSEWMYPQNLSTDSAKRHA